MWPAIGVTAALLAGDRVLKALSRKGKLHYEGKVVRLTNLENPGFFLGKGSRHRAFLRWGPLAVWIAAAFLLLPQAGQRDGLHTASPRREEAAAAGMERGGRHAAGRRAADGHRPHPGVDPGTVIHIGLCHRHSPMFLCCRRE